MRPLFVRLLTVTFAVLIMGACKKQPISRSEVGSLEELMELKDMDFRRIRMNGKLNFQASGRNMNVNLQIRMNKDSLVWASFTGPFGIEAARVWIRPDSFMIINRLNKSVSKGNFDKLKQAGGLDLTFSMLQNGLVGNMPYSFLPQQDSLEPDTQHVQLFQKRSGYAIETTLSKGLGKMTQMKAKSPDGAFVILADLSDFQEPSEGKLMPMENTIRIAQPNKNKPSTQVSLSYKKVEFPESQSYSFTLPDSYKVRQL